MCPVTARPSEMWVHVWLLLLWEYTKSPVRWRHMAGEYAGNSKKILSLLASELLKQSESLSPEMRAAINGCLARYR